jgi:hypothetical protein
VIVLLLVVIVLSMGAGFAWAAVKGDSKPASKPAVRMHRDAGASRHSNCPNMRSNSGSTSYAPDV